MGAPWPVFVALRPLRAVPVRKILSALHVVIYGKKFVGHPDVEAVRNFEQERTAGAPAAAPDRRGLGLGVLRELALNFDLYLILFLGAAIVDAAVAWPAGLPARPRAEMAWSAWRWAAGEAGSTAQLRSR